ncbi:purine-binding chemotaxis protein CheW [Caloramator fervidus]|uniref:Purine-binding chemotaxis protein CheW n=1 Tax=Caloramator fervidus TaxID=29344 RepID=A0A1H5WMV2_9CLOT|nr:chemotaxis protein CheW [Caloramator fervidus]SEG00287.1 purine-binding chemotaxis protein CheW [Caloramator fervidus]
MDRKVIIFKLGNEEFACDIQQVERILGYIEPTKVPEAPYFVEGVINYQNTILPIINLRKKFNMNYEDSRDKKIIVVKNNNKNVGLLVDTVLEVTDIKEENIEASPDIVTVAKNKYIQNIIRLDNRIILNIDTEKILTKDELEKITN